MTRFTNFTASRPSFLYAFTVAVVVIGAALSGCDDGCGKRYFEDGSIVRERLSGERWIVTDGTGHFNWNAGTCAITVFSPETGSRAVSPFVLTEDAS